MSWSVRGRKAGFSKLPLENKKKYNLTPSVSQSRTLYLDHLQREMPASRVHSCDRDLSVFHSARVAVTFLFLLFPVGARSPTQLSFLSFSLFLQLVDPRSDVLKEFRSCLCWAPTVWGVSPRRRAAGAPPSPAEEKTKKPEHVPRVKKRHRVPTRSPRGVVRRPKKKKTTTGFVYNTNFSIINRKGVTY